MAAEQQDAPVEHARQRRLALGPVAGDFVGAAFRERPGPRLKGEIEFRDLENVRLGLAHRSIAPLETMTADPPIVAERSLPSFDFEPERNETRPAHFNALFDDEHMLAVAGAFELHDDAGEGRGGAAGRRIFDNAPAAQRTCAHASSIPLLATSFV